MINFKKLAAAAVSVSVAAVDCASGSAGTATVEAAPASVPA